MIIIDNKKTIENIRTSLETYLKSYNLKSMVVGVSGGIDSALICALAYPVAKKLGIELIGRSITIETNKEEEKLRARGIGEHFTTSFKELNLSQEFFFFKNSLLNDLTEVIVPIYESEVENKIRMGNVKARLRMLTLYDLAQKNKGLVLSTDNYTELMLGFWTLHGDIGDYGMVQELWKTEVYNMTEWIALNECQSEGEKNSLLSMLDAVATDGLGITKSDLDQILPDWKERYTTTREGYDEVDSILESYFRGREWPEDNTVIERHKRTQYKRNNPLNLKREDIVE